MNKRQYDDGFKAEAVKLAKEIGVTRAAGELQIPYHTLNNWMRKARKDSIDLGQGTLDPAEALSIVSDLQMLLKKQVRDLQRENKLIREENEILADAAAFFCSLGFMGVPSISHCRTDKNDPFHYITFCTVCQYKPMVFRVL